MVLFGTKSRLTPFTFSATMGPMLKKAKAPWKRTVITLVASGAGSGFFPVAPGTAGSVLACALLWGMRNAPLSLLILVTVGIVGVGIWASHHVNVMTGEADRQWIVIDEIAGMFITMIGNPITFQWLLWGFVWFRLMDIWKLFPGSYFDSKLKNGYGVMLDDVTAGIYANIVLHFMVKAQL